MENISTVTIPLEEYNRLKEIEKNYTKDGYAALESRNNFLENDKKSLLIDNDYLSKGLNNNIKYWVDENFMCLRNSILKKKSLFGLVSKKSISDVFDNYERKPNDYDYWRSWWNFDTIKDFHIYQNKTDNVSNKDFYLLHKELDSTVKNFMDKYNIKDAYTLTYSIDNLQELKKHGISCPSCDGNCTILDKDNNTLLESM